MSDLVERVAVVIADGRDDISSTGLARAAIAEVLSEVSRHLSAVQYDPAPYTAMKHRLEELRKDLGR